MSPSSVICALYICYNVCTFIVQSTNLPFSWDKVPTFAFPGAHDGFLTEKEVTKYSLNKFPQLLIWGFNASCQDPNNGKIYPATTKGSYYSCGTNHTFYANMEQSLQHQAFDLKQNLVNNTDLKVFGYIESTNVQQSYVYQHEFNSDISPFNSYHLKIDNIGVIDCFVNGCNWQGPSFRQYDHRQTSVRNYFVNSVVKSLVNSSYLDGFFMDSISSWMVTLCPQWNCTQQEWNDLYNGSLAVASQTVDLMKQMNKIATISAHVDLYYFPDYYWKYRQILQKYNGDHTIRFYECLEGGWGSSFYNYWSTLLNETLSGISAHVHVCGKTMNPSWVELAAFLIAANNQSWFSYSSGWTVPEAWYQPEFNYSLGKPLSDAKCVNDNEWHIFNDVNNIYGGPQPASNSSDNMIIYIGKYNSYEECLDAVKVNDNFGTFTWVDKNGGVYANMCYGKYGASWFPTSQKGVVSGHLGNFQCTREFEYSSVYFDILNYEANITWKNN